MASSSLDGLFLLSIAKLLDCSACPNEGGVSHIYTNQLRGLITQLGQLLLVARSNLHWKTKKYILIILLWVLMTRVTMEVLPQDFT